MICDSERYVEVICGIERYMVGDDIWYEMIYSTGRYVIADDLGVIGDREQYAVQRAMQQRWNYVLNIFSTKSRIQNTPKFININKLVGIYSKLLICMITEEDRVSK